MKHLALILALLIPQVAQARYKETKEECIKRYGEPLSTEGNKYYFNTEHFHITVIFEKREGELRCCYIEYMKRERDGKGFITRQEIERLLHVNEPGPHSGIKGWNGPHALKGRKYAFGWYHKDTVAWYNKDQAHCLIIEDTTKKTTRTAPPEPPEPSSVKGL